MSRRTAEKQRIYRLKLLLEENNAKSPDILSVIINAQNRIEAYQIAAVYEDVIGDQVPLPDWELALEKWQRTIERVPVELYFLFKRKKTLIQFVRQLRKEFPDIQMTI